MNQKSTTELLNAKRRDVRRVTIAMIVVLFLVLGGAAIWIMDVSSSRDGWRERASSSRESHSELSQKYSDLYDEYVRRVGFLPGAEPPSEATETKDSEATTLTIEGEEGHPGPAGSVGPRGARGTPGEDGEDGKDGKDGANGEDGVGQPGAEGSPGKDGASGAKGDTGPAGADGADGKDGADGADGADGKDGRGIAELVCDLDSGNWIVTWTTGETETVGACVVERTPPGQNG